MANKARSVLTVLGMVIGIASVIIVYSAGEGIYSLVMGQVEGFGTDIIQTEIRVPTVSSKGDKGQMESSNSVAMGVQVTSLTIQDMEDVAQSKNVKNYYASMFAQELVSYQSEIKKTFIYATSAGYIDIDASKIAEGRFYTEEEDKSLANVVVIGEKLRDRLFGETDPLGKLITIRKQKYQVIGVMAERGAVMFMDFDDFVYMPIRTLQKKVLGVDYVSMMVHQLHDISLAEDTAEEARYILRANHGITDPNRDDFRTVTMLEAMESLETIMGAITLLLLGIVIISLIVGGVGIMNIMYVIVSERTAEIGLRKAVGASYQQIMNQFLLESTLITMVGGVIGMAVGIVLSYLLALGARAFGLDWEFIVPLKAFVVSLIFSFIFGVLFGLYPARNAAKLDPIEALRNE